MEKKGGTKTRSNRQNPGSKSGLRVHSPGVAVAHLMFSEPVFSISRQSRTGGAQVFSEFVATYGLLSVIWGCARLRSAAVPFAVGAYITGAYWFTASTSFANPAVTIARSMTDTFAGIRPADVLGLRRRTTWRRGGGDHNIPLASADTTAECGSCRSTSRPRHWTLNKSAPPNLSARMRVRAQPGRQPSISRSSLQTVSRPGTQIRTWTGSFARWICLGCGIIAEHQYRLTIGKHCDVVLINEPVVFLVIPWKHSLELAIWKNIDVTRVRDVRGWIFRLSPAVTTRTIRASRPGAQDRTLRRAAGIATDIPA